MRVIMFILTAISLGFSEEYKLLGCKVTQDTVSNSEEYHMSLRAMVKKCTNGMMYSTITTNKGQVLNDTGWTIYNLPEKIIQIRHLSGYVGSIYQNHYDTSIFNINSWTSYNKGIHIDTNFEAPNFQNNQKISFDKVSGTKAKYSDTVLIQGNCIWAQGSYDGHRDSSHIQVGSGYYTTKAISSNNEILYNIKNFTGNVTIDKTTDGRNFYKDECLIGAKNCTSTTYSSK